MAGAGLVRRMAEMPFARAADTLCAGWQDTYKAAVTSQYDDSDTARSNANKRDSRVGSIRTIHLQTRVLVYRV
jgi:hypothetical protein